MSCSGNTASGDVYPTHWSKCWLSDSRKSADSSAAQPAALTICASVRGRTDRTYLAVPPHLGLPASSFISLMHDAFPCMHVNAQCPPTLAQCSTMHACPTHDSCLFMHAQWPANNACTGNMIVTATWKQSRYRSLTSAIRLEVE